MIDRPFACVIIHRVAVTTNSLGKPQFLLEMDSHTESPVVGNQDHVVEYTGRKVSVS